MSRVAPRGDGEDVLQLAQAQLQVGAGQGDLVDHQPALLGGEIGREFLELSDDGAGIFDRIRLRIRRRDIDQMQQDPGALQMPQETDAQPRALRSVVVLLSIPVLFLLIALVTIYKQSEVLIIVVIAFVSWLIPARLVRGETLTLRVREYVQAVRVMGGSRTRIVGRHIVPNAIGTIVVFATFQVADSILLLAALGFIGLGIPAPGTDWGTMLSNGVDSAALGYWWQIYPAGLCIVLVVIAFNFIGDSLRDALEVRLQRR